MNQKEKLIEALINNLSNEGVKTVSVKVILIDEELNKYKAELEIPANTYYEYDYETDSDVVNNHLEYYIAEQLKVDSDFILWYGAEFSNNDVYAYYDGTTGKEIKAQGKEIEQEYNNLPEYKN